MGLDAILMALGALGGATVVVGGLSAWLGKVWAERIYLQTAHKHDQELEVIRHAAQRELDELRALREGERDTRASQRELLTKASLATQERALKAVERLWDTVVSLREFTGGFLLAHDVLIPSERAAIREETSAPFVPQVTMDEFTQKVSPFSLVEKERPFLGERLWQLYWIYRQFALRIVYKTLQPDRQLLKKPAAVRIPEWNQNLDGAPDSVVQVVSYALSESELQGAIGNGRIGVPRRILDAIERKILEEINVALFGRRLLEMSLGEQQRLADLAMSTPRGKIGGA